MPFVTNLTATERSLSLPTFALKSPFRISVRCWSACQSAHIRSVTVQQNTVISVSQCNVSRYNDPPSGINSQKCYKHKYTCNVHCLLVTWHWCTDVCYSNKYEVCSNSIRIAIAVVVHWVACVCNQSCHVRACLSNSWHNLQVAAFAQLAAVGRGNNTCVCVRAICTMCESAEQRTCIEFCFKIGKTANGNVSIIAASIRWRCNGAYTGVCLVPSV